MSSKVMYHATYRAPGIHGDEETYIVAEDTLQALMLIEQFEGVVG